MRVARTNILKLNIENIGISIVVGSMGNEKRAFKGEFKRNAKFLTKI